MIELKSLHKFFNKGRQNEIHVINDISLKLPERGMVAIFGKSGCGKTTLLNVIGGLDRYGSGSLTIEGKDVRRDTDVIRNQYIGYIFQNYNLNKTESCFDNVADALRLCGMTDERAIEERVMAALANVGMDKYRNRTPDTLSGGQQQRIAIARAIVKNPRIILADEPTGNLDEANTVMIMDLLKQIAKDHLVLLVTHEANLVDYYCDTVVELSDGRMVNMRNNTAANGFSARDKNDIFLGELEKTALESPDAEIEYFGASPDKPIKLRIVNNGGKFYVQINTPGVQILDEYSEVKLREGVFEQKATQNAVSESIDMSKLPPVQGHHYGRLFTLKSSIKSGYASNFKSRKKGKMVLRGCMCLFAAVLVLMSSVFGSAFDDIINAREAYNHNVFYVYTPDSEVSQKLNNAAQNGEAGIDYVRLNYAYLNGDTTVKFMTGFFETFSTMPYDDSFRTNAVMLDTSLAKDLPLVCGKKEGLATEEVLITTAVADALLEKSSLGYISEHKDLLGLISSSLSVDDKNLRIAGVVKSDETAIYLTDVAMAKYVMNSSATYVALAADYGLEVASGETVLVVRSERGGDVTYPNVGETIKIHGIDVKVTKVVQRYNQYDSWLVANGFQKPTFEAYVEELMGKTYPDLVPDTDEYHVAYETITNEKYFDYYDTYYAELDLFLRDYYFFEPNMMELWLAVEKGVEAARYLYTDEYYFKAVEYKKQYGEYPTLQELENVYTTLPDLSETLKNECLLYEEAFYESQNENFSYYENIYLVSANDYVAFSHRLGETHSSASSDYEVYDGYVQEDVAVEGVFTVMSGVSISEISPSSGTVYTVLHSTNPEATAAWLAEQFPDLDTGTEYRSAILTPDMIFERVLGENYTEILTSLITMVVLLAVMSVCMYFIMRSSLMNRIKEVGIYRAIGVSKKNLTFKFLIEAVVLTTLTVFIGYLITSAFMYVCLGVSPMVEQILYYPIWLAGALLVILYLLCLFCGTLPILSLLHKTPSEILAKYDI